MTRLPGRQEAQALRAAREEAPEQQGLEYVENLRLRRRVLELYDAEQAGLRRYLTCLGVDRETGRELVQDCFLKLQLHLAAGGDETNLRAWLYRVAHNLARNVQTSHRNARTDLLPDVTDFSEPRSAELTGEERLLDEERHRLLRACLARLSERERECLTLRSQGLKYREIAAVLECSVSVVNENVQRAVERLKGELLLERVLGASEKEA